MGVEVNFVLLKPLRVLKLWVRFESGNNRGVRNSWRQKDGGSLTVLDVHSLCSWDGCCCRRAVVGAVEGFEYFSYVYKSYLYVLDTLRFVPPL